MANGNHTVIGTMTANKVAVTDTVVVANLNADQVDGADKDIDGTLAGNSDASVPTEKAVKTYVDTADALKEDDDAVVHDTGAETVAGVKTFSDGIVGDVTGDVTGKADEADGVVETGASVTLQCKVIEIGDWNMNTTTSKTVTHGVGNYKKIRSVSGIIRDDSDVVYASIPTLYNVEDGLSHVGIYRVMSTYVELKRFSTGIFDNSSYESAPSGNRGWIMIWYEV